MINLLNHKNVLHKKIVHYFNSHTYYFKQKVLQSMEILWPVK